MNEKMVATIELKTLDFDDENFSPVFNRKTQEHFHKVSDKFQSELALVLAPTTSRSIDEYVDKFLLWKPNHSYFRNVPIEKMTWLLFGSYFIWSELPLSTFSARCWVLFAYWATLFASYRNWTIFFPSSNISFVLGSGDRF